MEKKKDGSFTIIGGGGIVAKEQVCTVGSKVGIIPAHATPFTRWPIAVVKKITATTVTVEVQSVLAQETYTLKFSLPSLKAYGCGQSWVCSMLTTFQDADDHNKEVLDEKRIRIRRLEELVGKAERLSTDRIMAAIAALEGKR